MATNLGLDDAAIEDARILGGHKSKKAAVVRRSMNIYSIAARSESSKLFGTIDYDPEYDYKAARRIEDA